MDNFASKSMCELQKFLKIRGVTFSNQKKADLVSLCEAAAILNIEIDPDGMIEDRAEILNEKLTTEAGILVSPQLIEGSYDISLVSSISIFDIYNYLISFDEYDHAILRNYHKLEGYTMQQDGYVLDVTCVDYKNGYFALKSKVKPRTCDKDPVTKQPFYVTWILVKSDDGNISCVQSAYCSCRGGMDGCCRHTVATLFEVLDFAQDFKKDSCTSGTCQWIRRPSERYKLSMPVPATDLNTSVLQTRNPDIPRPCNHQSLPATFILPDPNEFLQKVKTVYPKACILDTKYVRPDRTSTTPDLNIQAPMEKLRSFLESHTCIVENCSCSNIFQFYDMCYTESEQQAIEMGTRGQATNNNWHEMRKGLITASNFKAVCSSTNGRKTSQNILRDSFPNDCVPQAIEFGRKYENKARNMYLKSHRFKHRQCKLSLPGLTLCDDDQYSFLGCSPDGIIDCKICGRFLLEVKCSFKYKCFHPANALKMSSICDQDENGSFQLKTSHSYHYQIQGQMAITNIRKCVLVNYTHKGIQCVDVEFDEEFWTHCRQKLVSFYKNRFFNVLKEAVAELD